MRNSRVFNPETSPIEGTMLLEASAGTGKTYALERMVARLVGRDENPLEIEKILVVTFTNRAAREMKERIRSLLSVRAKESERSPAERERYRAAISGFDRSAIYTIHGFCQMVLSSWPFESSSPFRQELVPGGVMESTELRSWIAGLKKEDVDKDLMRTAYRQAGGIEKLIKSISDGMVNDNIPPGARVLPTEEESADFAAYIESSRLAGSPLNMAAEVLFSGNWSDDAVNNLIKTANSSKRGKTGTSLEKIRSHMMACHEMVSHGISGIIPLSEALFGDPAEVGIKNHFLDLLSSALIIDDGLNDGTISSETVSLASAISVLLHEMEPYIEFSTGSDKPLISLTEPYMQSAFLDIAHKSVKERLENLKNRTGRWGYADLIRRVADKVVEPESPLLPILRKRFGAALIDEFQDTDPRQWKLFNTIFGGPEGEPGGRHVLGLIGDPKQSIYGFRGTGLQAYNEARSTVPGNRVFRLDTNYRSTALLVAAANRFFSPLFNTGFEPVLSGKSDSDELIWPGAGVPVTLIEADSKENIAESIVSEIRSLLDPVTGGKWRRKTGNPIAVSASDIAVLVRGQIEEQDILNRLGHAGIPVVRIRSRSVFTQDLVTVVIGLLDAFEKPRDMALWRSVLLDEFFKLPPDLLMRFQEEGRLDDFVERGGEWRRLFLSGRSTEAFDAFFRFSSSIGIWVTEAGRTGLGEFLKIPWPRRVIAEPDGLRQWQDWRHICELIQNRQAEGVREISRIKTWITEHTGNTDPEGSEDALRLETEASAVRVLTMHTAKGLEFPLVFLHGGYRGKTARKNNGEYRFDDDGTLVVDRIRRESNRTAHLAYEWEEDKRLWYVAFTRASVKLWIPLPREGAVTQVESLLDEAFNEVNGTAPEVIKLPTHQILGKKEAVGFRANLREGLAALAQESPQLFSTMEGCDAAVLPLDVPPYPEPIAAELPKGRLSDRDPVTSSYTSLVRSAADGAEEKDDRDVDELIYEARSGETLSTVSAEEGLEPLPMASDRGALFGTLVHALLEDCDFQKVRDMDENAWYSDAETDDLFSSLSRRYYPPDWYRSRSGALKKMVWCALRSRIHGPGRLCDLDKAEMRAEVEFQMAILRKANLSVGDLRTVLAEGFLKGFIDLLLKTDGRWWVVDWKTNVPPGVESAEAYDASTMKEIMDYHHYHLQYELYLLALCRTLSGNLRRAVDWEEEIGGAAYLFVRGMREEDGRGVYVAKPPLERMLSLASAMGFEGVLK